MSEITKQAIVDKVFSDLAKEAGLTVEEYRKRLADEHAKFWCLCGNPSGQITFHDDATTLRTPQCCYKHHYHCDDCGKITQVG